MLFVDAMKDASRFIDNLYNFPFQSVVAFGIMVFFLLCVLRGHPKIPSSLSTDIGNPYPIPPHCPHFSHLPYNTQVTLSIVPPSLLPKRTAFMDDPFSALPIIIKSSHNSI